MRAAFARRARLVPALHTANHDAQASGVAALRPLYYDHATLDGAYRHKDTYLFCDGLLVAPVTSPQDARTRLANRSLWLPPGQWVDVVAGTSAGVSSSTTVNGSQGTSVSLGFTLSETPVFARVGTMLPTAPAPGAAVRSCSRCVPDPSCTQLA
jgi:alpha-glucosidase (family GH31 glycosyl hydrolase)